MTDAMDRDRWRGLLEQDLTRVLARQMLIMTTLSTFCIAKFRKKKTFNIVAKEPRC